MNIHSKEFFIELFFYYYRSQTSIKRKRISNLKRITLSEKTVVFENLVDTYNRIFSELDPKSDMADSTAININFPLTWWGGYESATDHHVIGYYYAPPRN